MKVGFVKGVGAAGESRKHIVKKTEELYEEVLEDKQQNLAIT